MTVKELRDALKDFEDDVEEVEQKHGFNIGSYENKMDEETETFDIMFIPALGYDAQFLRIGKRGKKE